MSLKKCEGVEIICETHLSSIQCVYFWSIHNPFVELQSKKYLGIISGSKEKIGGSFRGRDHFRVNLGIISGPGIISRSGSFRGLYRSLSLSALAPTRSLHSRAPFTFKLIKLKTAVNRLFS